MAFKISSCIVSSAMVLASPSSSRRRATCVSRSAISFCESSTPRTSLPPLWLVDEVVGGHRAGDQDGDDVDHLDHRVDGRSGGVLVGVSDRVARDRRLVRLRPLPTEGALFDPLLCILPAPTT